MYCYTTRKGVVNAGIVLFKDPVLGPALLLGEDGRGRHQEKIALNRQQPAGDYLKDDGSRIVYTAQPWPIYVKTRGSEVERTIYTLRAPDVDDKSSALVRVDCEGTYTRNTSGRWELIAGSVVKVAHAWGAYGDAGRIGEWWDDLIVMPHGAVIKVFPSGGADKSPRYAVRNDQGVVTAVRWADYELLTAIEEG